jgi:hypothetical protein
MLVLVKEPKDQALVEEDRVPVEEDRVPVEEEDLPEEAEDDLLSWKDSKVQHNIKHFQIIK